MLKATQYKWSRLKLATTGNNNLNVVGIDGTKKRLLKQLLHSCIISHVLQKIKKLQRTHKHTYFIYSSVAYKVTKATPLEAVADIVVAAVRCVVTNISWKTF